MNELKRRRLLYRLGSIFLTAAALASIFAAIYRYENGSGAVYEGPVRDSTYLKKTIDGKSYCYRDSTEALLLIGIDKFQTELAAGEDDFNNNEQADFLLLLVLDRDAKTVTALHLNRDTMTSVGSYGLGGTYLGTVTEQLAKAHTYGSGAQDSCRNTVDAVSGLLGGIPVSHYLRFTMDAVSEVTDAAGGVSLTVDGDLIPVDPSFTDGASVTLQGEQALKYIRARAGLSDSTNLSRMNRQRGFMTALYDALRAGQQADPEFFTACFRRIADYVLTDCTSFQLETAADCMASYRFEGILSPEGQAVQDGSNMAFYPDEEKLQKTVLELFYESDK